MDINEKRRAVKSLVDKIVWNGSEITVYFTSKHSVSLKWNNMFVENEGSETWEKLKYWRCKKGYLQREVADGAGITRAMYMSYEKRGGACPAEILVNIAEFLEVDFDEFADDYHRFQLCNNQCERIKKAREKLGLSKTQFANIVGVDRSTVYRWEKYAGKMSRKDYMKVKKVAEI